MSSWIDTIDRVHRTVDSVDDLTYAGALGATTLIEKFPSLSASPVLRVMNWLGKAGGRVLGPLAKPLMAYNVGKNAYGATRNMYENPNVSHPINESGALKMAASWGGPVPYFPTNIEMGMNPEVVAVGWDNTEDAPILEHNGVRKPIGTVDPRIVETLRYNKNKLQKIGPNPKTYVTRNLGVPSAGYLGVPGYSVQGERIDMGRAPSPTLRDADRVNARRKNHGLPLLKFNNKVK